MAMSFWPSAGDISDFLAGAGFDSLPSADLSELVSRAVDEVHATVGFSPFLADGLGEYAVEAVDGSVNLDLPFASVTGVSFGENTMEFLTCPQGVTPIRKLVLAEAVFGEVVVTGRVGYGLTIPFDIWYAVRDLAASYVVEMVGAAQNESVETVKQDSVTISYRSGFTPERLASILADRAKVVFRRYQLLGIGS